MTSAAQKPGSPPATVRRVVTLIRARVALWVLTVLLGMLEGSVTVRASGEDVLVVGALLLTVVVAVGLGVVLPLRLAGRIARGVLRARRHYTVYAVLGMTFGVLTLFSDWGPSTLVTVVSVVLGVATLVLLHRPEVDAHLAR